MKITRIAMLFSLVAIALTPSRAIELITDGDFEISGTTGAFVGWQVFDQGSGTFSLAVPNANTVPLDNPTAQTDSGGQAYALTENTAAGAHVLLQTFTVPSTQVTLMLTFQMFVNNYASNIVNSNGLVYNAGPNQHTRVDILTADADPFTTTTGVVASLYLSGTDSLGYHSEYTSYSYNITSYLTPSGTYKLRFAEVDNQANTDVGVDNVSITTAPVPEPTSICLLGLGAVGLVWKGRKRFCR